MEVEGNVQYKIEIHDIVAECIVNRISEGLFYYDVFRGRRQKKHIFLC